jgi:phosphoribosylanthranilate isomerase
VSDWSLIKDIGRPFFLAGGLRPDNAAEAIARLTPYAVDTSSGVETDYLKNPEKITCFIKAVREG